MSIPENLTQIVQKINIASANRSTHTGNVKLVAVTKNHGIDAMRVALDNGVTAIGENRIQEAISKYPLLNRNAEWHLIGHLQTNKVRHAIPLFDLIHSVDSERLAAEINKTAGKLEKRQDVLIQVNVAGEDTKYGIPLNNVRSLAQYINDLEHVRLCGLMTIAPYYEDIELTRPVFRELYYAFMELKDLNLSNSDIRWLSMGMTNDYVIAIEEGANLVRIGTGIFGKRDYNAITKGG